MSKVHGHHHVHHSHNAAQTAEIKREVKAEVQNELKALLPQLKDQFQAGGVSGAMATGGGATLQAPGGNATGGASDPSTPVTSVGGSNVDGIFNSLGSAESGLLGTLNEAMTQTPDDKGMITVGGKKVNANAYLQQLQFRLSSLHEMMNTLSNILKDENQARMNTINNLRG